MSKYKLGGAALNQIPLDWKNNKLNIVEALHKAKKEKIDLLCLPELCITGYGCEDLFLHPWVSQRALDVLMELLPETSGIATVFGLPFAYEASRYNVLAFVADGVIQGFYAKQHLPKDGVHYEPRWFEPWPSGSVVQVKMNGNSYPMGHITATWRSLTVAFEICEDAWRGADRPGCHLNVRPDVVLNPSASHFAFEKEDFRKELVRSSSEQLDTIYIYANQLGNEAGKIIYDGDVMVAQKGRLLATASRLSYLPVSLHAVNVDFDAPGQSEVLLYDHLDGAMEEFPQAVSLALFDYMRKSKSSGFVLSLSGGADSSTLAVMVAEMVRRGVAELGLEDFQRKIGYSNMADERAIISQLLTTAYQETKNSSTETLHAAEELANSLGATFYHWGIDDEVYGYTQKIEKALGRPLTWEKDDVTLQNIQARARSPIIWMLANERNALLLATSNRSEGAVGYTTMDGDTSGSLSPIAGVGKPFVRQWLKYAEKKLGYAALRHVNALAPTAELRPAHDHQTDEGDLMPYDILQQIEEAFVLRQESPDAILNALSKVHGSDQARSWVDRFFVLWTRNQWKRERYAPAFHLDTYSLDSRSWMRHPILSAKQPKVE